MIALSGGLRAAGYDVTLVVTSVDNMDFSTLCGHMGIEYIKVPECVNHNLSDLLDLLYIRNPARQLRSMLSKLFFPYIDGIYQASRMLCCTCDMVIGHFMVYPLKVAAEKTETPMATVTFWPGLVPTAYESPYGFPDMGKRINSFIWGFVKMTIDALLKRDIKRLWEKEGLPPFRHVLPDVWYSGRLNILAASPLLWRRQPDWGIRDQLCGFLNIPDEAEPWQMPARLCEFLDKSSPPVYMTLGSAQVIHPERNMELFIETAKEIDCKAIIQTSSEKHPPDSVMGNIYFISRVPHHKIFPHCAAIVHHGGAGTTHSATRSGCPSVVVAFSNEELSWGEALQRAGVANAPIRYKKVTPKRLARGIGRVLSSFQIREDARELGARMRRENGVAEAIKLLEELVI